MSKSDCVGCGGSSGPPPLPPDAKKMPPPISVPIAPISSPTPIPTPSGGRVLRNRTSTATTSAAAAPGAGARAVMDKLNAPGALRGLNTSIFNASGQIGGGGGGNIATAAAVARHALSGGPAPAQASSAPMTIEAAARAAGLPHASSSVSKAASMRLSSDGKIGTQSTEELLGDLWKKHAVQTDALKSDLEKKLAESMGKIKDLKLNQLTAVGGALSGFDANIDASRLTEQDVINAEFMKNEKHSISDADVQLPVSDFMQKRMQDHEKKFIEATEAALKAVSQPIGTKTAQAAVTHGGAPHALSAAEAASINQHLKTTEMRDRRARHANQTREQMKASTESQQAAAAAAAAASQQADSKRPLGLHPTPIGFSKPASSGPNAAASEKKGYAPIGTSAPNLFGLGGLGGLGGAGGSQQLGDLSSQLKAKVAETTPELQQQAELVSGLAGQLQNWQTLATKMGSLQTYMGVFGKHVRLMLGVQDDARHYSVQHYRGPLLTLLDNDTVRWYRRNDISQAFANAGCSMTWQGTAPAPGENAERGKRFQLQWHDVVMDYQHRPITIGTAWNATSQRQNMAVARFSADGKTLDPSFYSDPSTPTVGSVQTSIFQTESRGVQALITSDGMRLLLLATVMDHDTQQLVGTICALNSSDGKQDTAFGTGGTVGITADGYQGCVAVRMALHPITGDILVLLRLQSTNLTVNKITSLFLKFKPDGTLYPGFMGVFVDSDNNNSYPNVWLGTDIAWSTPDSSDRSMDRIVVTGTIVSQLGDELSQPFVRQYTGDGTLDSDFGAKYETVQQYVSPGVSAGPRTVEVLDMKNAETNGGNLQTGTAQFFAALNEADDRDTTGGLLATTSDQKAVSGPPPNLVQTASTAQPSTASSVATALVTNGKSGLIVLTIPNSTVSTAQRVIVYDRYIEVLGVAYDDVQGTYGVSFICQIDLKTQNQNLMLFQLADVYQTTVAQNFAIDFVTGSRCIVGYALHNSTQIDSADAFIIKVDGAGKIIQKSRLALGGDYFQTLSAVAVDQTNKRFVTTGYVQNGKTIYTRAACLIYGPATQ